MVGIGVSSLSQDATRVQAGVPQKNRPVWEEGTGLGLPRLETDLHADVCVVGLGGSGLACVLELLKLGRRVVGLEARTVAEGAAGRNGGFLLAGMSAFYHDAVRALGWERAETFYKLTLTELDRMTAETPDAVRRPGSLRIATSAEELADCEEQFIAMRADGLSVERYEGAEGQGLLFPGDGVFNPLERCRTLAKKALHQGAQLFENSPSLMISGTEVGTARARVRCKNVVVAVDGGLERLLPELRGTVRTARLQMLATAPEHEVTFSRPVYARYGYEYWQQLPDGRVALGGFRDRAGPGEWTHDAEPGDEVQSRLTTFLRATLGVTAPVTHRWAASVGYTSGVLPYFGEVRLGVWAVGGYNGTGNVVGALCGRGMAQRVVSGTSVIADLFQTR